MFATFDEIQAMTLQDIKETKRHGRTDARKHGRTVTDGQRENSIPSTKKCLNLHSTIHLTMCVSRTHIKAGLLGEQ